MSLKLITAPAQEPVTLADVKAQLSIATGDTEVDAVITRRITEARQWVEEYLGRALLTQTWELALDAFPAEIELPRPPAQSVASVTYTDAAGATQTMDSADYVLDDYATPAWVVPAYGASWPSALDTVNAVKVRYVAGYASADDVPGPIKEAIHLIVGHWMRFQPALEAGVSITRIPYAVEQLLFPYKQFRFV